VVGKDGILG